MHLHQGTRRLKAAAAIKNRNRRPLQQHREADRAVAEVTTINQVREAKGHEPAGTQNRLLKKTGILHDHTALLPASVALSTVNFWIKNAPTGNSTVA
jgi:hypothetical protein